MDLSIPEDARVSKVFSAETHEQVGVTISWPAKCRLETTKRVVCD